MATRLVSATVSTTQQPQPVTIETPLQCAPSVDRYFCTLAPVCRRIIANVQSQQNQADQQPPLSYSYRVSADQHRTADHTRSSGHGLDERTATVGKTKPLPLIVTQDCSNEESWRDEHSGPFSWRSSSQECLARRDWSPAVQSDSDGVDYKSSFSARRTDGATGVRPRGLAGRRSLQHTVSFNLRDSIRKRVSKLERFCQSSSRQSDVDSDFEHPSLVLSGCGRSTPGSKSSSSTGPPVSSIKEHLLAGLARGRRVLLSIRPQREHGSGGRRRRSVSPSSPITQARSFIDADSSDSHPSTSTIDPRRHRRARSAAPALHRLVISAPYSRGSASSPPPRPRGSGEHDDDDTPAVAGVCADMVAIRTARSPHAMPLRSTGGQLVPSASTATAASHEEDSGEAEQQQCQQPKLLSLPTPPPQLKRVAPPVVPSRSTSSPHSRPVAPPIGCGTVPPVSDRHHQSTVQAPPLPEAPPPRHRSRKHGVSGGREQAPPPLLGDDADRVRRLMSGREMGMALVNQQLKQALQSGGAGSAALSLRSVNLRRSSSPRMQSPSTSVAQSLSVSGTPSPSSSGTQSSSTSVTQSLSASGAQNGVASFDELDNAQNNDHPSTKQSCISDTGILANPTALSNDKGRNVADIGNISSPSSGVSSSSLSFHGASNVNCGASCLSTVDTSLLSSDNGDNSDACLAPGGVSASVSSTTVSSTVPVTEELIYSSVLQQTTEVGIKTGFDFLDNW